jgi:predicted MFS family arabinose efflux permease
VILVINPLALRIRPSVYLLGATVFVVTTSELMVAGIMPSLAAAFDVSLAKIGQLISLFALGMALGGPLVTALLLRLRVPNKPALLWLLGLFVIASIVTTFAPGYATMAIARTIQGASGAACFSLCVTISAELVRQDLRGRAASYVLAGLMLSPVMGVPATALLDQVFGWRVGFGSVAALAMVSTMTVAFGVHSLERGETVCLTDELEALRNGPLWLAYATSGLVTGATFAAFGYFAPILTDLAGLPSAAIAPLLAVYGVASVAGNLMVGRFADRLTIPILIGGLVLLASALAVFALYATVPIVSVPAFLLIGLFGPAMNPAMVTRVMRTGGPLRLVNSLHASIITAGIALGTWAGGRAIDAGYGLTAPVWIGFALALAGLLSLVPPAARK